MAASRSMFDAAEDDDTPAIEQKIANQDIIGEHKEDNQPNKLPKSAKKPSKKNLNIHKH